MATGARRAGGTSGFRACGSGLHMPGLTGVILITTITTMAGTCMKATGTMRTMATATMTTTMATTTTTREKEQSGT